MPDRDHLVLTIEDRNRVRRDARLPLLNVDHEVQAAIAIREQAVFDRAFTAHTMLHPINGAGHGWMTRLGYGAQARRKFRNALAT